MRQMTLDQLSKSKNFCKCALAKHAKTSLYNRKRLKTSTGTVNFCATKAADCVQ